MKSTRKKIKKNAKKKGKYPYKSGAKSKSKHISKKYSPVLVKKQVGPLPAQAPAPAPLPDRMKVKPVCKDNVIAIKIGQTIISCVGDLLQDRKASFVSLFSSPSARTLIEELENQKRAWDLRSKKTTKSCGSGADLGRKSTLGRIVDFFKSEVKDRSTSPPLQSLDRQAEELAVQFSSSHNSSIGSSSHAAHIFASNKTTRPQKKDTLQKSLYELLTEGKDENPLLWDFENISPVPSTSNVQYFDSLWRSLHELRESESALEDPTVASRKTETQSPKRVGAVGSAGEDVKKLQHELKKAQSEITSLKGENSQLKDEGIRLRKVAMTDTVSPTPLNPSPAPAAAVRAFPPVVYVVAAIILGLIIGKFLL